ncbi:MAG: YceD family protein [Saprospiraceae bacterium]
MDVFRAYSLPILGLKPGMHHFEYALDRSFFDLFADSPIAHCEIRVTLDLDKRPDMMILDFDVAGSVGAACDRCTADIDLPVARQERLVVKYGEQEDSADDEVVFIPRDSSLFNVAPYLYEYSVLSLPMVNVFDCQLLAQPPCNQTVLAKLERQDEPADEDGSVWDALKDIQP